MSQNLPYAPGSSSEYVFQTFEPAGAVPPNVSFSGQVDAFVPSANCSLIDVTLDGPSSIQGFNNKTNTTNTFPNSLSLLLPNGSICEYWRPANVPVYNPLKYVTPTRQLTGTYQELFCSLADQSSKLDLPQGRAAYLYTITDVRYTQKLFTNATQLEGGSSIISYSNSTSRTVKNIANVLCLPHYTITRLNVTNSTTAFLDGLPAQVKTKKLLDVQNHTITGFSARNLSSLFETAALAAPSLLGNSDSGNVSSASQVPSGVFDLLTAVKDSTDYSIFLNEELLRSAAEEVFNGLTLELVRQNLMSSDQTTTDGEAFYPLSKLYIRPVSLWVMTAGFSLLIILTILLLWFSPSAVVSREPSSIAAHAAILARSTDLNRELRKDTTISDYSLRSTLAPHFYRASVVASDNTGPVFKIQVQTGPGSVPSRNLPIVKWWHPMMLWSPVLLAMILVPVGVVVGLEVLQRISDHDDGIMTLPPNHLSEAYTHYIPALVMLLVAALFTTLDFMVAVFAPFSALRSEHAASPRAMLSRLQGRTAPFALVEAVRCWQPGAILSLIAALVASVLAIVASGLYSVQLLSMSGPARSLSRLDVFNVTWENSYAKDNGAAATLSLIEHQNTSYPDFTFQGLAFPKLALSDIIGKPKVLSVISGPATATIPALRANLNCTILPGSAYNISMVEAASLNEVIFNAEFDLPSQCSGGNQSILQYAHTFKLVPTDQFVYAGAQLDLLFRNGTAGVNYGETHGADTADNPPGCPSLAFTFGRFKTNSTERTAVTTMVCHQELQQVSAQVRFYANSTQIDTVHPPVVDEATVQTLANPLSDSGGTFFEYRIQSNLANEMASFYGSDKGAASGDLHNNVDIFFQTITKGLDATPEQDLVGLENHENFYQAVNRMYRKYMALAINANMRKPCPASGCPSDLLSKRQASFSDLQATISISVPRLVQSQTSKLVLQILLGVMLFCGSLAYILTPMRNVLPCNPCNIAGTMALLAGSKLCWSSDEDVCECCGKPRTQDADSMIHAVGEVDHHEERLESIPHGTEWASEADLKAVFSKMRYTLGWWKRGYGNNKHVYEKRYGIDIGRADGLDDQDWELGRKKTRRYTDDERHSQRKSRVPNWLLGPLKEAEPATPRIAEQLSDHQVRQSRMPEWMLGPLKPERVRPEEHELHARRSRPADNDGDLGVPQPLGDSRPRSRIPNWLLGPLKPDVQDEAGRETYARPEEALASGALRGPVAPGRRIQEA